MQIQDILTPLVSIGMPVFNRPDDLRKSLESITKQTYVNIEIIISNNNSTDSETQIVIDEFLKIDERIKSYRQEKNIGSILNFEFVLNKSSGKYFMWASNDDLWNFDFVEKTTFFLENNTNYVAVSMEAQYFDIDLFDYFPEGKAFYSFFSNNYLDRLYFALKHSYGNLIYGLYRREVLIKNKIFFSYNEIAFFLQVFKVGNWRVLPEIGIKKKTTIQTYRQAKWEMVGGKMEKINLLKWFFSIPGIFKYHFNTYIDILKFVNNSNIQKIDKSKFKKAVKVNLTKHFFELLFRNKSK
jgi:glycosyltransferase involved in cell wall biosynthesis